MSPRPSRLSLNACEMASTFRPQHLQSLPISPHAPFCESQAARTVQRLGILRNARAIARYEQTKLASLSGIWFPSSSKEVVQVCTDINWWVATFDDRIDGDLAKGDVAMEDTARVALIQEVVAAFATQSDAVRSGHADPHVLYAQHIFGQLQCLQNADQDLDIVDRFMPALQEVLLRSIPANKALHNVASIQEYIQYRFDDCFVQLFFPLLQTLALSQPISAAQLQHPDLKRLEDLTSLLVLFLNDVVSYAKERASCDNPRNIIHLISVTQSLPVPEAHDLTVTYINEYYEEFLGLSNRRIWSKSAAEYIEALQRYILGFMDWSKSAYRYQGEPCLGVQIQADSRQFAGIA